jgi:flagellar biosynthesis regulator FlbT
MRSTQTPTRLARYFIAHIVATNPDNLKSSEAEFSSQLKMSAQIAASPNHA